MSSFTLYRSFTSQLPRENTLISRLHEQAATKSLVDRMLADTTHTRKMPVSSELNAQEQHLQQFWGKWLRKGREEKEKQEAKNADEDWVEETEFEQSESEAWGLKRPRRPEQTDEDLLDSDWDDDDDDSGGHMMPVADW
jgi:hypothetical protein